MAGIKAAGEAGDWRAWEAFLRMSFPADYRRDASVNVNASAAVQQVGLVCDEAMRARLIALHEKIAGERAATSATPSALPAIEATVEPFPRGRERESGVAAGVFGRPADGEGRTRLATSVFVRLARRYE